MTTMNTRSAETDSPRVQGGGHLAVWIAAVVALPLAGLLMNQMGRPAPRAGALARGLRRVADALDQIEQDEQQQQEEGD